MIDLEDEFTLAESYLRLQQQCYGFNHIVNLYTDLNRFERQVPPFILKPFLENIVNDTAALQTAGNIAVRVNEEGADLIV